MSRADRAGTHVRRAGPEIALTLGTFGGIVAAILPLTALVEPARWLAAAAGVTALLLAVGFAARRLRAPAVAVTLLEVLVWLCAMTLAFFPASALFGVVPTLGTVERAADAARAAASEIVLGIAPLTPSASLTFVLVAALGLLTIALDHVVLTARLPLLAGVALVAVWLIAPIATSSAVDLVAFGLVALLTLVLMRAETRSREPAARAPRDAAGMIALTAAVSVLAIGASLLWAPALPSPERVAAGSGVTTVNPSLNLGTDLRQPGEQVVLTLSTNMPSAPYLRMATLSIFDGQFWRPDRQRTVGLAPDAFGPLEATEGMRVTEYESEIQIADLSTDWLPVPYAAFDVEGLRGDWVAMPFNRTVVSGSGTSQGQEYHVTTRSVRPTLEEIRATTAGASGAREDLYTPPDEVPTIITETANEVTADASTDYDKLIALQDWFRGADFEYSLDAPVDNGFDGTNSEAIADFLEVRAGYCVHFASAFALMARELGMPSRIVIGFLPGTGLSGAGRAEDREYEVLSSQLHAWPEVHFEGVGWVSFEPTKSLGVPTAFVPSIEALLEDDDGEDVAGPTATPTPTPSQTTQAPTPESEVTGESTDPEGGANVGRIVAVVFAILLLLSLPALVRLAGTRVLLGRARRGSVGAAWRVVQETALDLGIEVPAAETARAFGERLVREHGAPAEPVSRLASAVERSNYANGDPAAGNATLADDAARIRSLLLRKVGPRARAVAWLLPRSLLIRPRT